MLAFLEEGQRIERDRVLRKLVDIQYQRNDYDFHRGTFRVRGDTVEVFPAYEESRAVRIEFFGDEIDGLCRSIRCVAGDPEAFQCRNLSRLALRYELDRMEVAVHDIRQELRERLEEFRAQNKLLEAQRLEQRTMYDLDLLWRWEYVRGSKTIRAT